MGEQPKPVEDEVERALASMRAGFLSGSEQIAAHIAALDQHLVDAAPDERDAVRAQVGRLVAAHERITARVMSAPPSSWDSFKVMVSAVKQQQAVLDQVSHLVQQHVLPRQMENLAVTPFPSASAPPPADDPPPPAGLFPPHPYAADGGVRPDEGFRRGDAFRASDAFPPAAELRPEARPVAHAPVPQGRRQPARRQPPPRPRAEPGFPALAAAGLRAREAEEDDDLDERPSLLTLLRERTAGFRGLAAMVAVGVILSMLPRDRLQQVGTKLFEIIGPAGTETTSLDDPQPSKRPTRRVLPPRSVDRVPSAGDAKAPSLDPAPRPDFAPEPKAETKAETKPGPVVPSAEKQLAAAGIEEPPRASPIAPKPVVAPADSEEGAAPQPTEERFVPVVFTHKDHATVMRALTDLKQQYPKILIGLEGEIQPIDMGKKGIWHRLIFLPAGPRPQASKVCEQLASRGYDRCYVREY